MARLNPDLVVTQDICTVCAVSSGDLATACPIGTETFSMNPRTLDDVIESVITFAELLGVADRGRAIAGRMRRDIEAVRALVADQRRPRAFVAEWVDPPYGSGHWLPEMVEAAGGTNLLSSPGEYSFPTTWEAVLEQEPEIVVVAACGFNVDQSFERARHLRLPVRTVVVDGDSYFSRPAPRLADGVRQLGYIMHPTRVPNPGLPYVALPRG